MNQDIFATADDAARFFGFRRRLYAGDFSVRWIHLEGPAGSAGTALARWLGDFTRDWHSVSRELLLDAEEAELLLPLPLEEMMLPGGRGRVHIVHFTLLEAEDVPRLAELLRPFSDQQGKPWWVIGVGPRFELPEKLEGVAEIVRLRGPIAEFPG